MKKDQTKQVHVLKIKPAIKPGERRKIEVVLQVLKYKILGGGQRVDGSECDISFQKK